MGIGPGGVLDVYDYGSHNLYLFNPANGTSTLIGNTGQSFATFAGLGDGRLFGINDTNLDLFQVNPLTGASTFVSHLFDPTPELIFFTSLAGNGTNLFFTYEAPPFVSSPQDSTLYRVNPNTGTATAIGLTGVSEIGGSGFIGGKLYGLTVNLDFDAMGNPLFNSGAAYTLNTATGAGTLVSPYSAVGGTQAIFGAVSTPEPGTWALSALGLLALVVSRMGKR